MDIVQRLRTDFWPNYGGEDLGRLLKEAADEIERLRSQISPRPIGYYWVRTKYEHYPDLLPWEPAKWCGDHWKLIGLNSHFKEKKDVPVIGPMIECPQEM